MAKNKKSNEIPPEVIKWLENHFEKINKIYTDRDILVDILYKLRDETKVITPWWNKFYKTIEGLDSVKILKYLYDIYLESKGLAIGEEEEGQTKMSWSQKKAKWKKTNII